jgi:hypothetical protein
MDRHHEHSQPHVFFPPGKKSGGTMTGLGGYENGRRFAAGLECNGSKE